MYVGTSVRNLEGKGCTVTKIYTVLFNAHFYSDKFQNSEG